MWTCRPVALAFPAAAFLIGVHACSSTGGNVDSDNKTDTSNTSGGGTGFGGTASYASGGTVVSLGGSSPINTNPNCPITPPQHGSPCDALAEGCKYGQDMESGMECACPEVGKWYCLGGGVKAATPTGSGGSGVVDSGGAPGRGGGEPSTSGGSTSTDGSAGTTQDPTVCPGDTAVPVDDQPCPGDLYCIYSRGGKYWVCQCDGEVGASWSCTVEDELSARSDGGANSSS